MALCARCGQQTEPDAEFCLACGGYVHDSSVGARSDSAYLPASGYGAPSPTHYQQAWTEARAPSLQPWTDDRDGADPLWRPEPDQSRSNQPHQRRSVPGSREVPAQRPRPAGGISGRWIPIAVSTVVVCVAAAAAAVLVGHHGAGGHAGQPGRVRTSARPTTSASAPTPEPTASGAVTVEPAAAAAPHEAAVVAVLDRYFSAINSHSYGAYERLFSPALRSGLSPATFMAGYGTSRDSAETLQSIGVPGAGQLEAVVTFTSHQQAAGSLTQSSCTAWRISLYLIRQGHRYLLAAPPQGYQASYHSCS